MKKLQLKANSWLRKRYGNALEASTYRIKNEYTRPTPVSTEPKASVSGNEVPITFLSLE